jgi:hypothetical protein
MSTNNTAPGAAHLHDELKERFEGLLADNTAMPLQARSDLAEVMTVFAEMHFARFADDVGQCAEESKL